MLTIFCHILIHQQTEPEAAQLSDNRIQLQILSDNPPPPQHGPWPGREPLPVACMSVRLFVR